MSFSAITCSSLILHAARRRAAAARSSRQAQRATRSAGSRTSFALLGFLRLAAALVLVRPRRPPASSSSSARRGSPRSASQYFLGVDGISTLLILLTTLMGSIAILSSWTRDHRAREGVLHLPAVLQTGMLGRLHGARLLPVLPVLGGHAGADVLPDRHLGRRDRGSTRRSSSSSTRWSAACVMLLGILALYFYNHSRHRRRTRFDVTAVPDAGRCPSDLQWWVFLAFFLGFAIKVPMFPFHTWLPDAHTEAPTAGSVILAGVLLKMGTYGFMRFSLPILPRGDASTFVPWMVDARRSSGSSTARWCALAQKDLKRLVAYSSVSHMGFVMLGMFALNPLGHHGQRAADDQPRHLDRRAVPARRRRSTSGATRARSPSTAACRR